jgi:hypothetical protein
MTNDAETTASLRDAHRRIIQAIADLKALNVPVPASLYLAAHALSYATASRSVGIPAVNGQGHSGAI